MKKQKGRRVFIYGPGGVGKTSLGADAPGSRLIPVEDGVDEIDANATEQPESLDALFKLVEATPEDCENLVIDTATAIEGLIQTKLLGGSKDKTVEDYGGGWGKWRQAAIDMGWKPLLAKLDRVRANGTNIVVLGHSIVKTKKDPDSEGWDQHQIDLEQKAGEYLFRWCDMVGFFDFDDVRVKEGTKAKGMHTGLRRITFEYCATAKVKSRVGVPPLIEVPLEHPWSVLGPALERKDTKALSAELAELCKQLPAETAGKALAAAKNADPNGLVRIVNKCRGIVAEQGQQERIAS